jgi:hypothetical protein
MVTADMVLNARARCSAYHDGDCLVTLVALLHKWPDSAAS